jgi:hypothetical protein
MIIMSALMTHAVLYKDVFTLIPPTNALPKIDVLMLNVSLAKDAFTLITLIVAMILINVTNSTVIKK